ncbi:CDP-2,3-bis-(O-geranylgeranyl)-sn-glycerol synthase [Candidatus Hodarchaeum mangrovi]
MLDLNIFESVIFILPAFVANAAPVFLGRGSLFNCPIDRGRLWLDNKRILGDGKTIRGFIGGVLAGILTSMAILYFSQLISINLYYLTIINHMVIKFFNGNIYTVSALIGFLLGFGALSGDIIGSFIKRRSGLKRGESFMFMDQLGFLITSILFVSIVVPIPLTWLIFLVPITLFLHISLNLISHYVGLQEARL